MSKTTSRRNLLAILTITLLTPPTASQKNTKRGIAYLGDTHSADNNLLLSTNTPLSWYYNWSPNPASQQIPSESLAFAPLIHGLDEASSSSVSSAINSLPSSSTHLLSFNEPDGTTSSGGSSISPSDAARSYIDHIVPYRTSSRKWSISHPSTTGSPNGLDWLRQFNASCYDIDGENGCPTDFIAAHWYGNFDGLAAWLGTLDEFYNKNQSRETPLKIWVTELALPQQDAEATVSMMNQSLPFLDGLDYVEKYAWFGAFRTGDANEWTGDAVALFDNGGGLTELGALYMGGEASGYKEGQKGEGASAGAVLRVNGALLACMAVFLVMCM
ncbi:glycoside hydrolase family 128 protein [Lophiostoma macrostomum CBS 122681]|uniref:Glycoside hydrolase family 128 protein n=1 Tax=Lophiostoma macrostomum CBS 122681 TaxID=1314788 RepID=A0A6A6TE51_9PLEO|nr:glycoside hydrolase family 128 protein [Lophiostoma macrostomum CBS 122681]